MAEHTSKCRSDPPRVAAEELNPGISRPRAVTRWLRRPQECSKLRPDQGTRAVRRSQLLSRIRYLPKAATDTEEDDANDGMAGCRAADSAHTLRSGSPRLWGAAKQQPPAPLRGAQPCLRSHPPPAPPDLSAGCKGGGRVEAACVFCFDAFVQSSGLRWRRARPRSLVQRRGLPSRSNKHLFL